MTNLTITIGTWNRKRRNAAGKLVRQKRHTINYRRPEDRRAGAQVVC